MTKNQQKPFSYIAHHFGITKALQIFFRSNWSLWAASLLSVYPQSQSTAHCSVVLCQKWFEQQCRRLSTVQFLEWRSDSLHLALGFWNLISGRRVKGWRPRPDPAENGACVKRFTPWGRRGGGSVVQWRWRGGGPLLARQTLSTSSPDHP